MPVILPDWLFVPKEVRDRVPKMPGASPDEIHRSHLPLLHPEVSKIVLSANPQLGGPTGSVRTDGGILRPYQEEAAKFIRGRHGSVLAMQMGCVVGDTLVPYQIGDGDVHELPIRDAEVAARMEVGKSYPIWESSCYLRGQIATTLLGRIVAMGCKPVVQLTTYSGRSITLTPDHKILCFDATEGELWLRAERTLGRKVVCRHPTIPDQVAYEKVVRLEDAGEAEVYDQSMLHPHNFLANGIVVHNCGKTRTALAATYAPDRIGVIVAPLVAWSVWKKEIKLVYDNDYPVYEVRGKRLTDDFSLTRPGIYLLNPEIVRDRFSEWYAVRPEFVILDEAHLYINRHTRRHAGARSLATRANHRVALTGTPILRHVVDLHGILNCVCAGAFGGWYDFAIELGGHHTKHRGVEHGAVPQDARDRLDRRLSEVMIQKRWEEVSTFVPSLHRERVPVVLSDEDAREYNRLMADVRNVLGPRTDYSTLTQAAKMIEIGALRRFVGRAKVSAVVDLCCSTAEPVVVWSWHRDVAYAVGSAINKREGGSTALVVTGKETQDVRDAAIVQFQQGSARVIVCTIGAAGLGIDFTISRFSIFAEQSWTPADMSQCEARVHRASQQKPCVTYWPIVTGSIEEHVLEVLQAKEEHAASGVLDGIRAETESSEDVLQSIVDLVDMVVGGG